MSAALTSCGGGGGDPTAAEEPIDRYLGTWAACESDIFQPTLRVTLVVSRKANANAADFTFKEEAVVGGVADCETLTSLQTVATGSGTLALEGTKVAEDRTWDKATLSNWRGGIKELAAFQDGRMLLSIGVRRGFDGGVIRDAAGYPERSFQTASFKRLPG